MRTNGSRVIACAMALAMATSITFPVGAFAEIGEPDQLQHEQGSKVTGGVTSLMVQMQATTAILSLPTILLRA